MASKNITRKHKHLQPVPDNKPIELATTPAAWQKLDQRLERAIEIICGYDDNEAANSLLLIIDLLGNPEFDPVSRNGVFHAIQKYTFLHTGECERSLQSHLDQLNPIRKRRSA